MDDTTKLTPHERLAYLARKLSQDLIPPRHDDLLHAACEVRDIIGELSHRCDNRDGVVSTVCRYYGIEERFITGKSRIRQHAEPRRVVQYLLRKHTNMTLSNIADATNRDHTTVIYSLRTVEAEIMRNPTFARGIDMLNALLRDQVDAAKESQGSKQAPAGDQVPTPPAGAGVDSGHGGDPQGSVPQD